ncbi:unnamed protein product [Bemisia tabaci]|uniref:RRM domain-containing protein n=1 Tax=Bemisia tabaci TaxID=7038 RepID=A0A9P0AIW6_BEMTA|nr:unnamed protein product [Bemisia tabaci]
MSICTYHVTNNVFVFFLNWFHLLKLLQKFGNIEKFDLLFHRSGPLAGQPRGYAFVTYSQLEDAKRVKTALDGTKVGTKNIAIKWAYNNEKEDDTKSKPKLTIPALAGASEEKKPISKLTKIQAIEAKLKMMESTSFSEVEIQPTIKSSHSSSRGGMNSHRMNKPYSDQRNFHRSKPYSRS